LSSSDLFPTSEKVVPFLHDILLPCGVAV